MINFKPLKEKYKDYGYKLRITYKNGFKFKYLPSIIFISSISSSFGLTALAKAKEKGEREDTIKGWNKPFKEIKKDDWILTNKGELLQVLEVDYSYGECGILRVFNGVNEYNIEISDVREIFNGD